jgi:hypothetical protein
MPILTRLALPALALLTLAACTRPLANDTHEAEEHDLVHSMAMMQRWLDKTGRAAAEENWPLADFYLHELEETTDDLVAAQVVYHDQPVSVLTATMLVPAIEALEEAAKAENSVLFRSRYETLVLTCNACHDATGYGFIRITLPDPSVNPWNQDFRPAP